MGRNKKTKEEKAFEKWEADGRPQIFNKNLELEQDEYFVMFWNWKSGKYNPKYYVSNYGQVLSFIGDAKVLARPIDKKTGYANVSGLGKVHDVVFYSFARHHMKEKDKAITWTSETSRKVEEIITPQELRKISKEAHVHHINKKRADNREINLELESKEIHKFYHKLANKSNDVKRIVELHTSNKVNQTEPSGVVIDEHGIERVEGTKEQYQKIADNAYYSLLKKLYGNLTEEEAREAVEVLKVYDKDYIGKEMTIDLSTGKKLIVTIG